MPRWRPYSLRRQLPSCCLGNGRGPRRWSGWPPTCTARIRESAGEQPGSARRPTGASGGGVPGPKTAKGFRQCLSKAFCVCGDPKGTRTPVTGVRGRKIAHPKKPILYLSVIYKPLITVIRSNFPQQVHQKYIRHTMRLKNRNYL